MHEDVNTGEMGPKEHDLSVRVENHGWHSLWDGDQSTVRPLLGKSAEQPDQQRCSPQPLQVPDAEEERLTFNQHALSYSPPRAPAKRRGIQLCTCTRQRTMPAFKGVSSFYTMHMPSGPSSGSRSPSPSSGYQAQKTKLVFGQMEGDRFPATTAVAHVSLEHPDTPASSCLASGVGTDMASQQPPLTSFREPLSVHQAETWKAAANPACQLPPVRCHMDFHFQASARNPKAQSYPSQTPSPLPLGCTVEVANHARSQTGLQPSAATCAAGGAPLPLTLPSTRVLSPQKGMAVAQGVMKALSLSAS